MAFSASRWTPEAKQWLESRLRQHIEDMLVHEGNQEWLREILGDPKSVDWIVAWYREKPGLCVRWVDSNTFDPDLEDCQGEWRYETGRVEVTIYGAAELCRVAARFLSLDDWVKAERAGALESAGPKEPHADELLGTERKLWFAAGKRRARWPRPCRTCGAQFRPRPINWGRGRECEPCRIRRLQSTTTWCKPTPCRGCGKDFLPMTWNSAYCARECKQSYLEKKRQAAQ